MRESAVTPTWEEPVARPRSWTDDDLSDAVATATTVAEVVRRLRLARGGAAYITVRTRMEQLGLRLAERQARQDAGEASDSHGNRVPRRRTWTEEDLRAAVAQARSLNGVFVRLGLTVGGSQWQVIRSLILDRGWSTTHWDRPLGGVKSASNRGRDFRAAVAGAGVSEIVRDARSRAEVIRALGFEPDSMAYRWLGDFLREHDVPVDHFEAPHAAMRRNRRSRYRRPLDDILVEGSTYTDLSTLKRRLVEAGLLDPGCAICGIDEWLERPITLHLDHINGVRTDHRIENIRLICPNCHSQTDTFAGRNKGSYGRSRSPSLR